MKKVIKGYVGKLFPLNDLVYWDEDTELSMYVYKRKDTRDTWLWEDWPPRRVTVTIEVEE